jgi:hypothetical protein
MEKEKFINPFDKGVSYETFLKAIPKTKTIAEYCKGKLEKEQIEFLENEIKSIKK